MNNIQNRIKKLLTQLTEGIHERDQIIAIALLSAIAGYNTFLYGPPGTAKSLISRRLACAFKQQRYFEYLMNRFSTPEEVFGPVSIKELKEDRYIRQINDYLPTADFAFLDEIWKSSPAILNSLLTIINEHLFKNGNESVKVPLKSLIAASNEVPQPNQGLEALYDRFVVRLMVPPIQNKIYFHKLLNASSSKEKIQISPDLLISYSELEEWQKELNNISLSEDTLFMIDLIREKLVEQFEELQIYVSDRRWQRISTLLKACAFCNNRDTTNESDILLLKHCLWTTPENREKVNALIEQLVENYSIKKSLSLPEISKQLEKLEENLQAYFYNTKNWDTVELIDSTDNKMKKYIKIRVNYEPINDKNITNNFADEFYILQQAYIRKEYPLTIYYKDNKSSTIYQPALPREIVCDSDSICTIVNSDSYYEQYKKVKFFSSLFIQRKNEFIQTQVDKLYVTRKRISEIKNRITKIHSEFSTYVKILKEKFDNIFLDTDEINRIFFNFNNSISELEIQFKRCEQLELLCIDDSDKKLFSNKPQQKQMDLL